MQSDNVERFRVLTSQIQALAVKYSPVFTAQNIQVLNNLDSVIGEFKRVIEKSEERIRNKEKELIKNQ